MSCRNNRRVQRDMIGASNQSNTGVNRLTAMARKDWKARYNRGADMLFEVYVNSILSGPITHAVNISSNAILVTWSPTQSFLEGASAAARLDFKASRQNFGESIAKLTGIHQGLSDAYRVHFKGATLENLGYSRINKNHELAQQRLRPSITSEGMNADNVLAPVVDALGKFIRLPGEFLLDEDMLFKIINTRMENNAQAVRSALASSSDRLVQRKNYNAFRMVPTEDAVNQSADMADYYTFTNKLGVPFRPHNYPAVDTRPTGMATSFAKGIRSTPGARYMIPFFNTPTNIVKMGVRNSVFGNVFKDLQFAGELGARGDTARARIAMGTVIPGLIIGNMSEDRITGRIDMATPEGRFQHEMGRPEYSLRVGDEWISYETIEPFRSIVGMYATAHKAINYLEEFDPDTGKRNELIDQITIASIAPMLQTITDNYMLSQVGGILDIFNGINIGNPEYAMKTVKRTLANMTAPALIRQTNRLFFDETFRKADTYLEMLTQGIPGLSKTLPASRTIWGDERLYHYSLNPETSSMSYTRSVKQDPYDRQIIDLDVSLPRTPKKIRFQGVSFDINVYQQEKFAKLRGKGLGQGMPTLKQTVSNVMDSSTFKRVSDIDKRAIIEGIIGEYTSATTEFLIGSDPEFKEAFYTALAELQAQKARTRQ